MDKPAEHFKGYILALIGDKEYEKIMESVANIAKSLAQAMPVSSDAPQLQDHNTGYSFPSPLWLSPIAPIPRCNSQPPYNYQSSHNYQPSPYYPSSHPGPSHYRGIVPALLNFLGETGVRGSGNGGVY